MYKIAAMLALVVALAGCSSGTTPAEQVRTATPAPAGDGRTLTDAELTSALLTAEDLPSGYTAVPTDPEQGDAPPAAAGQECQDRFARIAEGQGNAAASAEAGFAGGQGVVLRQSLESFDESDDAALAARLDDAVSVLADCRAFQSTDPAGTTAQFTVEELEFPDLGDDTVGLSFTIASPGFELGLNYVIIRLGRTAMTIGQGGLETDPAALEQAARSGLDKLAAAGG